MSYHHDKLQENISTSVSKYLAGILDYSTTKKSDNHDFIIDYLCLKEQHGRLYKDGKPVTNVASLQKDINLFSYNLIYKISENLLVSNKQLGETGLPATSDYIGLTLIESLEGPQKVALVKDGDLSNKLKKPEYIIFQSLQKAQAFMSSNLDAITAPTGLKTSNTPSLGRVLIDNLHSQSWILKHPDDLEPKSVEVTQGKFKADFPVATIR